MVLEVLSAMIPLYLLLLLFILDSQSKSINITDKHQLEEFLCHDANMHNEDVTLVLYTNITHEITSGKFCTVGIGHSFTITSHNDDALAHINCISTNISNYWTRGFAFYGTNGSLTMKGLNFTNCGTNLTNLDSNIINSSSSIHFTQHHAALLVFTDIASLSVYNITILHYTGFAIAAVNLPNASFHYLNISSALAPFETISTGSGILLLFTDSTIDHSLYGQKISNSFFNNNTAFQDLSIPNYSTDCFDVSSNESMPVINAAAITILYSQPIPATVSISSSSFQSCTGYFAGAVLIMQFNSSIDSKTIISHCNFSQNNLFTQKKLMSNFRGSALTGKFYFSSFSNKRYQPLIVTHSTFSGNGFRFLKSGAVNIAVIRIDTKASNLLPLLYFRFKSNFFYNNTAYGLGGSCISAFAYQVCEADELIGMANSAFLILESIMAYNNPGMEVLLKGSVPWSLFCFFNINNITINGSVTEPGNYTNNYGTVFKIMSVRAISNIALQGHLFFIGNIANRGAAFFLQQNSTFYVMNGLRAYFINNYAQSLGGAMYLSSVKYALCAFQPFLNITNESMDVSLFFINNTAVLAGNAIYSINLYYCTSPSHLYWDIFRNASSNGISSNAEGITFCDDIVLPYEVYPGASVHIGISVYDANNSLTSDVVTVTPVTIHGGIRKLDWWFSRNQGSTVIETKHDCTTINLTIHTTDTSSFGKMSKLLFTVAEQSKVFEVPVRLKSCPIGFRLSSVEGACVCSSVFKHIVEFVEQKISCNIENNTFSKPVTLDLWIGNTITTFGIAYCNPNYCNTGGQFDLLFINETGSYLNSSTTLDTIPLCNGGRTGPFCGCCMANHSVVFGSTECKVCTSNLWPLTGIIYILAGPLLVFLLYTLRLTLTAGTLNGIIFYAQIVNVGIIRYFSYSCSECGKESFFFGVSNLFISWLNLNLGFPLCFYNGMTELWKAGLTLLFPVYLVLIIGFLIILSHFSSKVSNKLSKSSVQVLVTIVHLSFTKLLQAFIDVFGSAKVYEESKGVKTVWYNSGAVDYGSTEHKWLMIITSVIAGVILIPYMVLIVFGKFLMKVDRFREYIRPFYEAIHAPYKTNKWYWFAIYQSFVLFVYVAEALPEPVTVIFLIIFLTYNVFLYLQICSMPFKNKFLNILNLFLLFALNFVFFVGLTLYSTEGSSVMIFFQFSIYFFILVFFFIILYHFLLSTNQLDKVSALYRFFACRFQKKPSHFRRNDLEDCEVREPLLEQTVSY